ncbi:MAG: beta-lactamase family protein, partial [bacterium]|nr:beta-lactamase family protein [bacterium]
MIVSHIRKILLNSRISTVLISICLIFGAANLYAQIVQPSANALAELDQLIQTHLDDNNIPGCLVAVASRGRIIHLKTYGMANIELSAPVTDSTVFEIGSISKQFVSAAAMLLVEENKLGLDDPIHKYLHDLPSEWLGVT